jgi:hypothetical protein
MPGSQSGRFINRIGGLLWMITLLAGCGGGSPNQTTPASVSNPVPAIASLTPAAILAGSGATNVTINGTGFTATSVADFNGTPLQTTWMPPLDRLPK